MKKMLKIFIHIFFWILISHIMFDLVGIVHDLVYHGWEFDPILLVIASNIFLFYFNSYYLIPKYLNDKISRRYIVAISLSFIAVFLICLLMFFVFMWDELHVEFEHDESVLDILFEALSIILFSNLVVLGVSTSYELNKILSIKGHQQRLIALENKKARASVLIAQVGPHFLFNNLNMINSLSIQENAPQTNECILKLSDIMRYPVSVVDADTVELSKEKEFIKNFIDLQRTRIGSDYPIEFIVIGDDTNVGIAPLLFLPIIENAFKYGVSQVHHTPIRFEIESSLDKVVFKAENTVNGQKTHLISHNSGLSNLRERLELMYPNKHQLEISEGDKFSVNLTINVESKES